MKRVLVCNRTFYQTSETFIRRQVESLSERFRLDFLPISSYKEFGAFNSSRLYLLLKNFTFLDRLVSALVRRISNYDVPYGIRVHFYLLRLIRSIRPDVIHAHYGWNGLLMLPYARILNIPLVVSFHGNDASGWLKKEAYKSRLPMLFESSQAIVLCSPHMIDCLKLERWKNKIAIIPYGINVNDFVRSESNIDDNGTTKILHVGRLVPKKGVPDLISVFSRLEEKLKNIELHIIGDGPDMAQCRELVAATTDPSKVIFYGATGVEFVKELMGQCEIFVLNSRTDVNGDMEGLPNVILEAMSFGMAVVSTRHAGIPLAITSGVEGILVPEADNASLEIELERLITNPKFRIGLGVRAREKVIQDFTIENMKANLCGVLEAAASRHPIQMQNNHPNGRK